MAAAQGSCSSGSFYSKTLDVYGRVQRLASQVKFNWHTTIENYADKVMRNGNSSRYYRALRSIQYELAQLPPAPPSASSSWQVMRPLVMTMVNDKPNVREALRRQLTMVPYDFSVYHFDCRGPTDRNYRNYRPLRFHCLRRSYAD